MCSLIHWICLDGDRLALGEDHWRGLYGRGLHTLNRSRTKRKADGEVAQRLRKFTGRLLRLALQVGWLRGGGSDGWWKLDWQSTMLKSTILQWNLSKWFGCDCELDRDNWQFNGSALHYPLPKWRPRFNHSNRLFNWLLDSDRLQINSHTRDRAPMITLQAPQITIYKAERNDDWRSTIERFRRI